LANDPGKHLDAQSRMPPRASDRKSAEIFFLSIGLRDGSIPSCLCATARMGIQSGDNRSNNLTRKAHLPE